MRVTFTNPEMMADDTISQIGTIAKFDLPTPTGSTNRYEGTIVEVGNGFVVAEFDQWET